MSYHRTHLSGTARSSPSSRTGDEPFPEPYHSYGQKAAGIVLAKTQGLTGAKRKAAVKKVLDTVDPTLWPRVATQTRVYIKRGKAPGPALHAALARQMSAGMLAEIIRTGHSKQKPPPSGQLGLGCYGCVASVSALGGLTVVPAGGSAAVRTSASAPVSTTGVTTAQGVCTSDSKLINVNGQWHVKAPDEPCTSNIASEDVNYVISSGQPIYVGPFQFNPNAGPQVFTIETPDQVPTKWIPWINQVIIAARKQCAASGNCAQCTLAASDPTLTGPCNACMNQDRCKAYSGYTNECPAQTDPSCTTWPNKTTIATALRGQPITYESQRPTDGNWGWRFPDPATAAAIGASTLGTSSDGHGGVQHTATYPSDTNTYGFYTVQDWSTNLGIPMWAMGGTGYVPGLGIPLLSNNLAAELGPIQDDWKAALSLPPFAFFNHPLTGERWGVWITLCCTGSASSNGGNVGTWNVQTDSPNSYRLQIGFSRYNTDPPWWQEMLAAIFWLPALLFDVVDTVVATTLTALGDLACLTIGSKAAVGGAVKAGQQVGGGVGAAAGAAGAAIAQAACGTKPLPPPLISSSSIFTWLLVGGAGLAFVALATGKKKKKPSSAPSTAPKSLPKPSTP